MIRIPFYLVRNIDIGTGEKTINSIQYDERCVFIHMWSGLDGSDPSFVDNYVCVGPNQLVYYWSQQDS